MPPPLTAPNLIFFTLRRRLRRVNSPSRYSAALLQCNDSAWDSAAAQHQRGDCAQPGPESASSDDEHREAKHHPAQTLKEACHACSQTDP